MIFSLTIYAAPTSDASYRACRFARALLKKGHSLHRVFFYYDGAHHGNSLTQPPQGELNIEQSWAELTQAYDLDLVICIAAGLKRGIVDATEADRYEKVAPNLFNSMRLGGLGELVDATHQSDRVVTFGA